METEEIYIDRLIKIREVLQISGLSRSALYAGIKKREFPAQVKQSKRSAAWVHKEVVAWVQRRVNLRDASIEK